MLASVFLSVLIHYEPDTTIDHALGAICSSKMILLTKMDATVLKSSYDN